MEELNILFIIIFYIGIIVLMIKSKSKEKCNNNVINVIHKHNEDKYFNNILEQEIDDYEKEVIDEHQKELSKAQQEAAKLADGI